MITIQMSDEIWEKIKDQVNEYQVKEKKKVNITIRNRFTGEVIHESEKTTYKEAVEEAVKSKVNLSRADLSLAKTKNCKLSFSLVLVLMNMSRLSNLLKD